MKTIHHVIDTEASAAAIWSAITEQAGLAGWWSTAVDAPSAKPGARVDFTFGGDFNPLMEIVSAQENARLEWKCVDGHEPWAENTFVFELAPLDDGRTKLRFWQHYATELSDDQYGVYNFNWGYYLESLRLLCTTGAGKPYDPPKEGSR